MNVRTSIDPDCPYIPFIRGHSGPCNGLAHVQLAMAVSACIEPPMLRARTQEHSLCGMVPCTTCRRQNDMTVHWYWQHGDKLNDPPRCEPPEPA